MDREELFEELLQENSEIMKKRKRTSEMYKVLQKAVQVGNILVSSNNHICIMLDKMIQNYF